MIQEENGQFSQNTVGGLGGPTPTGTASNVWPNHQPEPIPPQTEAYRHCPTCTCGRHQYVPYTPYTLYYPSHDQTYRP